MKTKTSKPTPTTKGYWTYTPTTPNDPHEYYPKEIYATDILNTLTKHPRITQDQLETLLTKKYSPTWSETDHATWKKHLRAAKISLSRKGLIKTGRTYHHPKWHAWITKP
jgi:hypothetical protein